jgi:TonB-linked SusC/RagA family outer membrane protein
MLFSGVDLFAQKITQTGTVVDKDGEPIIGAGVVPKDKNGGTVTDMDGNFTIQVEKGTTLTFSSLGYLSVDQKATGTKMNITLFEDVKTLDEVVVVGYGTMNKKHIAGSMTSVDGKKIEEKGVVNVMDALQGSAPGMQVVSSSGAPGASSYVSIRGASTFSDDGVSPLYVVDGVTVDDIDDISPYDIKSVEIMKDAATSAIYGARAANGVILITTKSGQEGKPQVDVRYQHSFYKAARKLPQVNAFESRLSMAATDLANAAKTLEKFSNRTDSVGMQYSTNYYYQDLLLRTGNRDDASVQVSGGNKGFKYRTSMNYVNQTGIYLASKDNKYTGSINVSYQGWKNITFDTRIRLGYEKRNDVKTSVIKDALRRDPDMIIWYPDGELIPYYSSGGRRNPVAELTQRLDKKYIYSGNFYEGLQWKFTDWLSLNSSIAADYQSYRRVQFASKTLQGSDNGYNSGSDIKEERNKYTGEAYLTFNKKFGDHTLSGTLGASFEYTKLLHYIISGSYFISETIHYMNMATELDASDTYTSGWDEAMAGFFGRVVYSWKNRYTVTALGRYDGSSRFGQNNRWGFFPSISAAWRFSDEPFMDWASNVLTDAKLRYSFGITGNDRIGRYESYTTYTTGSAYYNGVGGVVPSSKYGNPNLKWEQTKQNDIGLDLSFLGGRFTFVADYYVKQTDDLLSDYNLPYTTGYSTMRVNMASIQNKGIELSLTATPISTKDWAWTTTINWWKNKNKITDLSREDYVQSSAWLVAKGKQAGIWYGYKNLGIYQYDASNAYTEDYKTRLTPVFERDDDGNVIIGLNGQPTLIMYTLPDGSEYTGTVQQMKVNGVVEGGGDVIWYNKPDEDGNLDGVIDTNDQTELGVATPQWYASWANSIVWRNFSLNVNFYLSWGGKIWNNVKQYYTSWGGNTHKQSPEYILQGWKYPGEITEWYALDSRQRKTNNHKMSLSDQFLEDGSFLRLQDVRLSYKLDKKWLDKTPMRSLQVYIYGKNLVTWTNYTGFDPEVGMSVLTPGKDDANYPRSKELGFGLNIGF